MLTINQLNLKIRERTLHKGISVQWPTGSLVGVLGPNGCGKTTFLNYICGLALKQPNKVMFNSQDVFLMPPLKRASIIASIAQEDEAELQTIAKDRIAHGLFPTALRALHSVRTVELVGTIAKDLGITDLLEKPLAYLSQGQRKKVHLARGLVDDQAQVYILDEPDAHLDAQSQETLMRFLKELCAKDKLVIVSLHNRDLAAHYCSQLFKMEQT